MLNLYEFKRLAHTVGRADLLAVARLTEHFINGEHLPAADRAEIQRLTAEMLEANKCMPVEPRRA